MVGSEISIKLANRYPVFTISSPIFPAVPMRFSDSQIKFQSIKKSPEKAAARFLANNIEIR